MKPLFKPVNTVPPKPRVQAQLTDLHSTFVWTRGADVMKTWRRYGWQPPTEYRNDYLFKVNRETALND